MTILERIRRLAQKNGTTIKQIERECDISNSTIRKWEVQSPSLENVCKVAQNLHTTIDYLAYGDERFHATPDEINLILKLRQLDLRDKFDVESTVERKLTCPFTPNKP